MHGINNISIMPDFINDYDLWDNYCGQVWQSLISKLSLPNDSTVIDLAPGASAKIEYALALSGFKGKLIIIEPHQQTGEIILNKAKKILTNAEIELLSKPFADIVIEGKVDAVFSNHPFDDFISAYLAKDKKLLDVMFDDISKEKSAVINLLQKIWNIPNESIEKTKLQIISDFKEFLHRLMPKKLILNQYDSSYFNKNGLDIINTHAKDLFKRISKNYNNKFSIEEMQRILDKNENYGNIHIGEVLLNAKNWCFIDYEKI